MPDKITLTSKTITCINLDNDVLDKAKEYYPYHGYKSLSSFIEMLIKKELISLGRDI